MSNECASVDWSWNNRSNGGASPSATAPLATSATGRIAPADHAPPFFQAPAAARQRPASGLDWLYRSATTSGALRRPETAKVHYWVPLSRPASVLDIGCGSGQWAYDLCQEFPDCLTVGLDLALPKPGQPENFAFVRGNLLQGLPFADDRFDFVHQRLLAATAIPLKQWASVVADLVRVTHPGGWVELVESAPEIESAGPATERLFGMVRRLGRSQGLDTTSIIVGSLGEHLTRAGLLDVRTQHVEVPVGDWGGRAGSLLASGVRAGMTRLMDSFHDKLGIAEVESRRLIQEMTLECDKYRSRSRFAIAFGLKTR